jgi:poly [ADP-ribose] polymerase 6/8
MEDRDPDLLRAHSGWRDASFHAIINTYSAIMYDHPATVTAPFRFELDLHRDFLPLAMQVLFGFLGDPILLHITIQLQGNWSQPPFHKSIEHPQRGSKFIGQPLVQDAVSKFFEPSYQPKRIYRATSSLLTPSGNPDPATLARLTELGFEPSQATKALVLCGNNFEAAASFLRTGEPPARKIELPVDYATCPLLYLVLEIAEAFFDLSDHCCICRQPLSPGVKPSICQKKVCQVAFTEIGVGTSLYQEISRDPKAADLVISVFSASVDSQFCEPAPPDCEKPEILSSLESLPPIKELVEQCHDDIDLSHNIGPRAVALLRWLLL